MNLTQSLVVVHSLGNAISQQKKLLETGGRGPALDWLPVSESKILNFGSDVAPKVSQLLKSASVFDFELTTGAATASVSFQFGFHEFTYFSSTEALVGICSKFDDARRKMLSDMLDALSLEESKKFTSPCPPDVDEFDRLSEFKESRVWAMRHMVGGLVGVDIDDLVKTSEAEVRAVFKSVGRIVSSPPEAESDHERENAAAQDPAPTFTVKDLCEACNVSDKTLSKYGKPAVKKWAKPREKSFKFDLTAARLVVAAVRDGSRDKAVKSACNNWLSDDRNLTGRPELDRNLGTPIAKHVLGRL